MSDDLNAETYQCPHCGGETFGLVVEDCLLLYARCRLCNTVVLDE